MTERKSYLDYAKAVGIFLVVCGHIINRDPMALPIADIINKIIYSFHMPLFFIVSGLGLWYKLKSRTDISINAESKKLFFRLMLSYIFWGSVYAAIWIFKEIIAGGNVLKRFLVLGYSLLIGYTPPLWFLYTLFISEILFFFIWNSLKKKNRENSIFAWGGVLILTAILTEVLYIIFSSYDNISGEGIVYYPSVMILRNFPAVFYISAGYLMGCTASKFAEKCSVKKAVLIIASLILAAFTVAVKLTVGDSVSIYYFNMGNIASVSMLLGLTGSVSVLLFCTFLSKNISVLSNIGKESMHIMVLHYPPIPIYLVTVRLFDLTVGKSICFLSTMIVVVICYMVGKAVGKINSKFSWHKAILE